MHLLKYAWKRSARESFRNRQEIIKARLGRREMFKLGLLTSAGYLVTKQGLSAWAAGDCDSDECDLGCSPPTNPFKDPLPIPDELPQRLITDPGFAHLPTPVPNRAINPQTGIPFEGRTQTHQFRDRFLPQAPNLLQPQHLRITRMAPNANFKFSEDPTNLSHRAATDLGFQQWRRQLHD